MKRNTKLLFLFSFCCYELFTQNIIKGSVKDETSEQHIKGALILLKDTAIKTETSTNGIFLLKNIPDGKQMLVIKKDGYETQNFPILLKGKTIDLGDIFLYKKEFDNQKDLGIVIISDDELNDENSIADNISGLLQSSKDLFLRTAAFDWSPSFFKLRGLDSENGKILINGIKMNKLYNGRPQWSNWGGLNNIVKNQEFSNYLTPSSYTFGGALGVTQINTRASEYKKNTKITYSSSNRSYVHRLMATYSSGVSKNDWSYSISGSGRKAIEGFIEGTSYNAYSFFTSVEKKINKKHSANVTAIYAYNKRGKSAANTQEVYDLKGIQYNPHWGYQNGKIRNSRTREIEEPIIILNHYWNISSKTTLTSGIAYQFGSIGNSRLNYTGAYVIENAFETDGNPVIGELNAVNPDPTYWQKLPSYALREGLDAYAYQQNFLNNGQIDWEAMYTANSNTGSNAIFILYDDKNEDKRISFNTNLESQLTQNITLNASLGYINQQSENFAEVTDLLGANSFLDVDTFVDDYTDRQNNLLNENLLATVGDKIKYHYNLNSQIINGFVQAQFKYNKIDFFIASNIESTSHQREGLFENGKYPGNASLGTSEKQSFINFSGKAGITYKINGRHFIDFNGGYISKAPYLRNIFYNPRENNNVVPNITNEKMLTGDFSYIHRGSILQTKATAYYAKIQNATDVSFYYASGGIDSFIQEILTDINKQHFGVELGVEFKVTNSLKLKASANIGQYTYTNNPNLYISSETLNADFGKAFLKDYKLSAGPHKVYTIGFEYRDPNYWWFSATTNFFNDTYVDTAPITRTQSFFYDNIEFSNSEGFSEPIYTNLITDFDEDTAASLLKQERFEDYMVINLVGGKSWKVGKNKYIGFFASVGNILNTEYRTGGYEQGRLANYSALLEDNSLNIPLFGNKYWYGRGTTYFLNINYRF